MDGQQKRGRGRPPMTDEQKKENKALRERGELSPGKKNWGQENAQPGDNSKYLIHAMKIREQPPIDITDPQQVSDRIDWYFCHCAESDMKPTVNGMCNALGIHRDTLHTWKTGEFRPDTHQAIVLRAYSVLEELWEGYMMNGKINPVSGIFLGKNMFPGYSDKQEFVLTPNQQGLSEADIKTIEKKYDELPDEIE